MPSYFTQRLSRRLLSLVQVADQPGGRGVAGTALGVAVGWAGREGLGAFPSLAGQVWYQSFTGDKASITRVSITHSGEHLPGEHRSGEPPGAVPELLGAPWLFPPLSGSLKWKLRVLEPRWRMTGTCAGQGGAGKGTAQGTLSPPGCDSRTHPSHRELQRWVEVGDILHTPGWAGVGGQEPARHGRGGWDGALGLSLPCGKSSCPVSLFFGHSQALTER